MNSQFKRLWAISIIGMLWGYGCAESADKSGGKEILHKPPYAAITDSIRQFPQQPGLYTARAVLLSQHNLHELATPDYKKAWELDPAEPLALQYVSNLLMTDEHREAVRVLQASIKTHPDNIELRRRLSEIYAQTGQYERALEQNEELVQMDSLNFEAWFERGVLLSRLKDTTAAIGALERSYALQPVQYTGLTLATLYAAARDPKTIAFCNELIKRDTAGMLTDLFYIKGTYYSDVREFDRAIQQFDSCINRDWKFADAYIEKGIVLFEQKKYTEALETFTVAVTVANTNPDAYFWMARCYEAMNNKDLAIANYERALALDKQFAEAAEGLRRLKG
jgi:tetratricopeptide (TPR) repeat protein